MDENKFWLLLWITIFVTTGIVGTYAIHEAYRENRLYIEHGYTQAALPGFATTQWIKGEK